MNITEQLAEALRVILNLAAPGGREHHELALDMGRIVIEADSALAAYEASKAETENRMLPYWEKAGKPTLAQGHDLEGLVEMACEAFVWYGADPPYMPPYLRQRMRAALLAIQQKQSESSPDDLRAAGLSVAVHNDYRVNGEAYTFWLFTTNDGRALKGEGRTDAEALNQVRAAQQKLRGGE